VIWNRRHRSQDHPQQLHHKANSIGAGRALQDKEFLEDVTGALDGASAILIAGPANAKTELAGYVRANRPALAKAIEGTETVDHPTDGELVSFARRYFKSAGRLF
jgi:stalled ribosome rescue protein Dom34